MADAARILQDALSLAADERARIAHELISSLDPDDAGAADAWRDEIRNRINAVEASTAELESWDAVRARLEAASRK